MAGGCRGRRFARYELPLYEGRISTNEGPQPYDLTIRYEPLRNPAYGESRIQQ